ncbi:Uncharacterised protein [Vibrio cholerae]|nr:Uncharacterised protein [Vibrio cholerae]
MTRRVTLWWLNKGRAIDPLAILPLTRKLINVPKEIKHKAAIGLSVKLNG